MTEQLKEALSLLNKEQLTAVTHQGSPLLILAGAGSGKTRVITTKIAYLIQEKNVNPSSILSVTFTKKAANEMKERAVLLEQRAEQSQIRTFHSFGAYFLRCYSQYAGVDANFTVYDDDDVISLIKDAVPGISAKEASMAAKQISLAKDYCLDPDDDLTVVQSDFDLAKIYKAYQGKLRATGNVDFGDLIMLPVKVIQNNPEVKSYIHSRYSVIMVDEYQDANIAQFKFLQALSGVTEGTNNYVCVVGDDDQSIYHFRGAEVQNILNFPKVFPNTQIIKLETNYRSTAQILHAADLVVSKNNNRLGKTLISNKGEGTTPVLTFLPSIVPSLELTRDIEAGFCAELINKDIENGGNYSDWAILYRTNAQSRAFETEFVHNYDGIFPHKKIPYKIFGSLKFFDREEIKDILCVLSLVVNPRDSIAFTRIINKPVRGIGKSSITKILLTAETTNLSGDVMYSNIVENMQNNLDILPKKAKEGALSFINIFTEIQNSIQKYKTLSEYIDFVIKKSGLYELHQANDKADGTDKVKNLEEFSNSAFSYAPTTEGLIAFLDTVNLDRTIQTEDDQDDKTNDYVTLITLHNTKGLEFKNVIITGVEEGVFPREDKVGADLEEERRLFYVGITRAKDKLFVTCSSKRYMYGYTRFVKPSVFIKESYNAFRAIGQIPLGYGNSNNAYAQNYNEKTGLTEIEQQYKKGTKIYHDDYGYGVVISAERKEEFVIQVQFENSTKKRFLPEYQKKSLTIIKD